MAICMLCDGCSWIPYLTTWYWDPAFHTGRSLLLRRKTNKLNQDNLHSYKLTNLFYVLICTILHKKDTWKQNINEYDKCILKPCLLFCIKLVCTSHHHHFFINLAIKKPIVSVLAFCRRLSGECAKWPPLHANSGRNLCSSRRWSHDRPAPCIPSDPKWGTWKRWQTQGFTHSQTAFAQPYYNIAIFNKQNTDMLG